MELEINEFEEGEIEDDEIPTYSSLERPANYSSTINPTVTPVIDSESEGEIQSTSDSDSDSQCIRTKKLKIKPKRAVKPPQNPKQNKYNIWSNRIQEDILLETLNSCDVTQKDRSRNIESYDYTLSYSHRNFESSDRVEGNCKRKHSSRTSKEKVSSCQRMSNKRTRDDRKNKDIRLTGHKEKKKAKLNVRLIPDVNVGDNSSDKEFAIEIANKLCEEKESLLEKIVHTLGREKALKIFKEVQRIEANGGMFVMYQNRRRTPGGIFLFLVKHDSEITKDQHEIIFEEDKLKYKEILKERKKQKAKERRAKIVGEKSRALPELLTKAELFQRQTDKDKWSSNGSDHDDVVNPPPTPETDGHADSGDGMESNIVNHPRKVDSYDDDFLDINGSNDMDLF